MPVLALLVAARFGATWAHPKSMRLQWPHGESDTLRQFSDLLLSTAAIDQSVYLPLRLPKLKHRFGSAYLAAKSCEDFNKFTVLELKEKLRSHGLAVSGKKGELVARLNEHFNDMDLATEPDTAMSEHHPDHAPRAAQIATNGEPVVFFTHEVSPYAQRVWITLEELGAPYLARQVNLRGGDREWYTADINPRGKVPAILDPSGLIIYESLICMEYLAEQYNPGTLMPSSPAERARMQLWNEHLDNQLVPAHLELLTSPLEKRQQKEAALDSALAYYEQHMEGPYLLGDRFTLADIAALPFFEGLVFSLRHFQELDILFTYRRTARWLKKVMERPSVAKTLRPESKLLQMYEKLLSRSKFFGGDLVKRSHTIPEPL